jgi:uncharacterized RDD family membrane protein YckC
MDRPTLQGQYAGFASRAAGMVLDAVIVSTILIVITWVTTSLGSYLGLDIGKCLATGLSTSLRSQIGCVLARLLLAFNALFAVVYTVVMWMLIGQTIGQSIMGVRVVRLDGRRITFFTALRRLIGYAVCVVTLGLGFVWVLIDDRRQGWHDKIAGTCVIYSWQARRDEIFWNRFVSSRRRLIGGKPYPGP